MSAAGPPDTAVAAPPRLQFRLLGRLEVVRDAAILELGPRKQRAVLAILLLNANRVVPTERLIDELWGERPPETARSALQVYVAGLRKALGPDGGALRTQSPGYVLDVPPEAHDLERFRLLRARAERTRDPARRGELLREALALWSDAPLADLAEEPFAAAAIARLDELRLEALEERFDADLTLGRHAALVPELEALIAEHPYRERLRAQLMLALYRSGRQADALTAYQQASRALREDLGLVPGSELRELEQAILRQDGALSAHAGAARKDEAGRRPPSRVRRAALPGVAVLVAAATVAVLLLRDDSAAVTVPPGSLAAIDPRTNEVVSVISIGGRPGPIAAGAGSLWVGNLDDPTLARVDPDARRVRRTIPLAATPTDVAVGLGAVWVAHGRSGQLSRVDASFDRVTSTADLAGRAIYAPAGSVAVGAGRIWAAFGKSVLARVDPGSVRADGTTSTGTGSAGVVVGHGSVWVSNGGASNVQRFAPATFEEGPLREITVGRGPRGMAVGGDAVWVAIADDDVATAIDPSASSVLEVPVGDGPEAIAVGAASIWVANRLDGTVSRIDEVTKEVVETIDVGNAPSGIAFAGGLVWLTVQAR